ncbi:MAG: peptide chain release factor-like protein [Chitinispirillaceae bacterium]|nr:peptide chain release factor-like protein [Chitinispirillaceae bacterium]
MTPIKKTHSELLSSCDVQTFMAGGRGGQHQNRTESAVRLVHRPTGLTAVCRDERSQHLNKLRCLEILERKLKKLRERPKPRIATAVPHCQKAQRREKKKIQARKKACRAKPDIED